MGRAFIRAVTRATIMLIPKARAHWHNPRFALK